MVYDAEAKVVGKEKGTGRCSNMMGKLLCKSLDGKVSFKVGSGFSDA
jgi:ATP-dependent DNA ligase